MGRGDGFCLFPKGIGSLLRVGGGGGGGGDIGGFAIDNPADRASTVVYNSDNDVSEFIWTQALERTRAMQMAAHALDQRSTQVATFQFAAAAFAAAGGLGSTMWPLFACAVLYLVGGICAFRGVRSDAIHLPGTSPAWWWRKDKDPSSLKIHEAKAWSAKLMQESITQMETENEKRGNYINASLIFASISSILLIILSFIWLFVK